MENTYNIESTVNILFHKQVKETPSKVAVVFEGKPITYQELDTKTNQLASYLISIGVTPETLIGFCLHRTENIVFAILGILKSGAAFMPLDPYAPEFRLHTILKNSKCNYVLSQSDLEKNFTNYSGNLICMNTNKEIYNFKNKKNNISLSPENLAYIIHTSGSTGVPKGVALEHKSLVNLLLWHKFILKDTAQKTLGFMPFTFDVSIQELFSTICTGGTYYLTSDQLRLIPEKLTNFVSENEIERIFMPFTPLQYFIKAVEESKTSLTKLNSILNVGEPLIITKVLRDFFNRHPNCKLRNQYGPTEATIMVTDNELKDSPNSWDEYPSIGKPIPNTRIYILNEKLKPVDNGEKGEVFIGGVCIARQYVNLEELTDKKFLPDPFSINEKDKMYSTGDLGKVNDDKTIHCLGRIDSQVKIRGFRVELGEIQTILMQHPAVKLAVAKVFELTPGVQQLVAYYENNPGQIPSIFELRSFLSARLPDYMLPHAFVMLEKFPQTTSGKTDRNALAPPEKIDHQSDIIPPKNELEKVLLLIWKQVLSIKGISTDDNFFVLGGDSILAAQIIIKVEKKYDIELSLANIFDAPTITKICSIIDKKIIKKEQKKDALLMQLLNQIENMSEDEVKAQLSSFK